MKDNNVVELRNPLEFTDTLTELLRSGARELISQAVEAELSAFMDQFSDRLICISSDPIWQSPVCQ